MAVGGAIREPRRTRVFVWHLLWRGGVGLYILCRPFFRPGLVARWFRDTHRFAMLPIPLQKVESLRGWGSGCSVGFHLPGSLHPRLASLPLCAPKRGFPFSKLAFACSGLLLPEFPASFFYITRK